jgi:hypothetical protein
MFKLELCLCKILVIKLVKQIYLDRLWTCFVIIKEPIIVYRAIEFLGHIIVFM